MDHIEAIEAGLAKKVSFNEIVRKIFLCYPTSAFIGKEEKQYEIFDEVSNFFCVPFTSIQIAGSAKTGKSFFKNTDFLPGKSDLDIAIIDVNLFMEYMTLVFKVTKGYSDRSSFPIRGGRSHFDDYITYLSKGIFRPDLMPSCPERAEWNNFFGTLSKKHVDLFASVNAGIYASQTFFESKQRSCIYHYKQQRAL